MHILSEYIWMRIKPCKKESSVRSVHRSQDSGYSERGEQGDQMDKEHIKYNRVKILEFVFDGRFSFLRNQTIIKIRG